MATSPFDHMVQPRNSAGPVGSGISRLGSLLREIRAKCRYLFAHRGFRRSPVVTLVRLVWWRLHCALGIPATLTLSPWNIRFYLPPQWHGAGTTMIYALRSNYETELQHLSRFISPGMVVVDGGASCGIYTTVAAKLVGLTGLVLSFEPGWESFHVLEKNVRLNRLENVRVRRAALSDKNGKATLYHHDGPNSFSLGSPERVGGRSEIVMTRSLPCAMQEETSTAVGLIKLDVEGAEELVLRGAERIITHFHPTIILEINGVAAKRLGLTPSGAWQFLQKLDYQFFSLTEQGELFPILYPAAANDVVNVIAIHDGRPK